MQCGVVAALWTHGAHGLITSRETAVAHGAWTQTRADSASRRFGLQAPREAAETAAAAAAVLVVLVEEGTRVETLGSCARLSFVPAALRKDGKHTQDAQEIARARFAGAGVCFTRSGQ